MITTHLLTLCTLAEDRRFQLDQINPVADQDSHHRKSECGSVNEMMNLFSFKIYRCSWNMTGETEFHSVKPSNKQNRKNVVVAAFNTFKHTSHCKLHGWFQLTNSLINAVFSNRTTKLWTADAS